MSGVARALFARPKLTLFLLAAAVLALGHRGRHLRQDNSPATFFAADQAARRTYREMVSVFKTDELLLLRIRGARVGDPRSLRILARAECGLSEIGGVIATLSVVSGGFFGPDHHVPKSAPGKSSRLCTPLRDDALEPFHLRALTKETRDLRFYQKLGLVSQDPPALGVLASMVLRGPDARRQLLRATTALSAGLQKHGLSVEIISLATANGVIDQQIRRSLLLHLPLVVLLCLVIGLVRYRSPALMVAILAPTGGAVLLGVSALELMGQTLNLVTSVMPPLVMAVSFAAGLHLVAHYRRCRQLGLAHRPALERTLHEKWVPSTFALFTTAVGFGSLSLSEIPAIAALGQSAAIALLGALVLVPLGTPLLILLLRPRIPTNGHERPGVLERSARFAHGHRLPILLTSGLGLVLLLWGASRVSTSFDGLEMLPRDAPERVRYRALERSGVGLGNMDVWIRLPTNDLRQLVSLAPRLQRIADRLEGRAGISGVFGPQDLLRLANYRLSGQASLPASLAALELLGDVEQRRLFARRLSFFWQGKQGLRLTLLTLTRDTETIARRRRLIANELASAFPRVPYAISGHFAMLIGTPSVLIQTLARSLLLSVGVVTLLFLVFFRRPSLVAAGMLCNLFPVLAVFGTMGLLQIPLDVATVMTGSVVFGIAVDDTFHYLYHYRKEGSLLPAARLSGEGILVTSMVIAGGFGVLCISSLVPVWRFGLFTALAMGVALATDALLLPALIAKAPHKNQKESP